MPITNIRPTDCECITEEPHKGAVKEEVVQIFRIGSTK